MVQIEPSISDHVTCAAASVRISLVFCLATSLKRVNVNIGNGGPVWIPIEQSWTIEMKRT